MIFMIVDNKRSNIFDKVVCKVKSRIIDKCCEVFKIIL